MLKIGLIGCGAIGTILAKAIDQDIKDAELIAIADIDQNRTKNLQKSLKTTPKITTIDTLIESSDLIIECAHKDAVKEILRKTLKNRKDILIMSVSGLIENENLLRIAEKNNTKIYIPTGAIAGIDALKAAKENSIKTVTLTTTKPKKSLTTAPYIKKNNINLESIKKKTQIFEGNVYEATKGFPQNVNVSATLALAGIGPKATKVKIIVDPESKTNSHKIEIEGGFGKITTQTENIPCPANPKTSYLAALSAIAKIKDITRNIRIGT